MRYLPNGQEMKACDRKTIEYYQIPSMVLMERAALGFVDAICTAGYDMTRTGIVCGMGNNGGDGLAVARLLHQKALPVKVYLIGNESRATVETAAQLAIVRNYGIPVCHVAETAESGLQWERNMDLANENNTTTFSVEEFKQELQKCTFLIDGIFGVGLSREVMGIYRDVIGIMNQCPVPKAAIDIPSGIDAGDGQVLGCAIKADMTVTFGYCKVGIVLYPGADYAGRVQVAEIGITEESFEEKKPYVYTHLTEEILDMLPNRPARSNKGTFGKAVLVVGSKGMAGAAYLAAMAAYRTGCGLVRVITPEDNREILQNLVPEAVLTTYASENPKEDEEKLLEALRWGDVVGIGSGLGLTLTSEYLVELVLRHARTPVVIDGDGLNVIANYKELLRNCGTDLIVTPHLGEMSRLVQLPIKELQERLVQTAADFAREYKVCCVLKDARTVVVDGRKEDCRNPLQEHAYLNLTGNHGMSTGGSGDVLMGMICGLVAQGMKPDKAAVAGVHLHGCAGDVAAQRLGRRGMIARDILEAIPKTVS